MPPKDDPTTSDSFHHEEDESHAMMLLQYGASPAHDPKKTAMFDVVSSPSSPPPLLQPRNPCDSRIEKNTTIPPRPRRAVAFEEDDDLLIQIHEIPSKDEYTVEEWDAIYLTSHDYQRIQHDNWETLRMMRKNIFPSDNDHYFRGLELQLPKARGQRQRRNRLAVKAILRYQKQQQWRHQTQNYNQNSNEGAQQHCCIPRNVLSSSVEGDEDYSEISIHAAHMLALWDHLVLLEDDRLSVVSVGDRVNVMVGCDI
jgi:hypothetical protein